MDKWLMVNDRVNKQTHFTDEEWSRKLDDNWEQRLVTCTDHCRVPSTDLWLVRTILIFNDFQYDDYKLKYKT